MTELPTETDMNYSAQQASCTDQQVLQALYCKKSLINSGIHPDNCISGASDNNFNMMDIEVLPASEKKGDMKRMCIWPSF